MTCSLNEINFYVMSVLFDYACPLKICHRRSVALNINGKYLQFMLRCRNIEKMAMYRVSKVHCTYIYIYHVCIYQSKVQLLNVPCMHMYVCIYILNQAPASKQVHTATTFISYGLRSMK